MQHLLDSFGEKEVIALEIKAWHNVAHKFIAARVTEIGFLNDGDLYIELVSAEVLLVKSTHQLSVWGKRRK